MIGIIFEQTKLLLKRKNSIFTLCILLWMIIGNYLENIIAFQGYDVSGMYEPMKLMILSTNKVNYSANYILVFVMIYPLIVSLPSGMSYIDERMTGMEIYILSRIGKKKYLFSKIMASFIVTFIIFSLPFFIDLCMHIISFPIDGKCDLTNLSIYSNEYQKIVNNYIMATLYRKHDILYAIIAILFVAVCSGIMGILTLSISLLIKVKYKIFLLLPLFIIINSTIYIERLGIKLPWSTKWFDYLLLHNDANKKLIYFIIIMGSFIITELAFCIISYKKETIL